MDSGLHGTYYIVRQSPTCLAGRASREASFVATCAHGTHGFILGACFDLLPRRVSSCRLLKYAQFVAASHQKRVSGVVAASVFHVFAVTSRAPAPRPARAAATLSPVMVPRTCFASRRRPYKGEIDGDVLLKQLLAVGAFDGGLCFVEGGVFDENVALNVENQHVQLEHASLLACVL